MNERTIKPNPNPRAANQMMLSLCPAGKIVLKTLASTPDLQVAILLRFSFTAHLNHRDHRSCSGTEGAAHNR